MGILLYAFFVFSIQPTQSQSIGYRSTTSTNASYNYVTIDTTILKNSLTALSGTYTIGLTGDYPDFISAINALDSFGVSGPVVFEAQPGIYTEQMTLPDVTGSDSISTITFQSQSGNANDVVIEFEAAAGNNWILGFHGIDYCTVQNITFRALSSYPLQWTVLFQNSSNHNRLHNCNIFGQINPNHPDAAVIRSYTDSKDEYNEISNNTLVGAYYGIYFEASSTIPEHGNQFLNNQILDYEEYGIACYYQNDLKSNGNCIRQRSSALDNIPINFYRCNNYLEILNNEIYDFVGNDNSGLRVNSCVNNGSVPSIIANNIISINNHTGDQIGLYVHNSVNVSICYNSVNIIPTGGIVFASSLNINNSEGPYYFHNNSIVHHGTVGNCLIGYDLTNIYSSNNNLYTNSPALALFHGTTYATLTDWQTLYPGDLLSTDGSYYGVDDLHSFSPTLNGMAMPLPYVSFDIDGEPRDTIAPDIGADEYTILQNDVMVHQIYHYGEIPVDVGEDVVIAIIKNIGSSDQLNLAVSLSITGANTFNAFDTINLLESGEADTIYFNGFSPTATGWNNIQVSTPNDDNNLNNSANNYNLATQNSFAYPDTSNYIGSTGAPDTGRMFLTKYYLDGLRQLNEIHVYITDDPDNAGNPIWPVMMDIDENIVSIGDTFVINEMHYNSWVTLTFPAPSLNAMANTYFYAGVKQNPSIAGSHYFLGYQDETPQRWDTYYYANIDGNGLNKSNFNQRWMIKANIENPAPKDAAMIAVISPVEDCSIGLASITVEVLNLGTDTILSFDLNYSIEGILPVAESLVTTILPGDIFTHTFATQFNFIAPVSDSLYTIQTWVNLMNDTLNSNDTIWYDLASLYTPPIPSAFSDTVGYGEIASLSASSNDTILWFESPGSVYPLTTGTEVSIGPLHDTTTIYVQSVTPAASIGISEMDMAGQNYIEIANFSDVNLDANGWFVAVSNSFTDINAVNPIIWELGYFTANEALYKTDNTYNNYWGNDLMWNNGNFVGWAVIIDDEDEIVDIVFTGGLPDSIIANWSPTIDGVTYALDADDWVGDAVISNGNNVYRNTFDSNSANDFMSQGYGNIGVFNTPIDIISFTVGCESGLVPVPVVVTNIPDQNGGVSSFSSPNTGEDMSLVDVCVEVENIGALPIANFPISYEINGTTLITEIFTDTIAPMSTYAYCFTNQADVSTLGTYNICVFTSIPGDTIYTSNDTICWSFDNTPLTYCYSNATFIGYEEIIEVGLGSFVNNSGPGFGSGYQDFTNLSTLSMSPGMTYPIHITSDFPPGFSYPYNCYVEVYIDWNHDGTYDENGNELVFGALSSSSNTVNGTVSVPITASAGNHGMRVVLMETSSASSVLPCGTYSWGETEDYIIQVMSTQNWDVGIIEILQPVQTPNLYENDTMEVAVVVANVGVDTISNMNIQYAVTGSSNVLIPWTGSLQAYSTDTVYFPPEILPGGNIEICASAQLTNDSNLMNNTVCTELYVIPQYDLALESILSPVNGCDYNLVDVSILINNLGDTIYGGVSVRYLHNGLSQAVEEVINDTIPEGLSYAYTFNTQLDLTVSYDTEFDLKAFISYPPDPVPVNDTLTAIVGSYVTPPSPLVNDTSIWSGETATLWVTNADSGISYNWYNADTLLLAVSDTFQTPPLFDTSLYLVEANAGIGPGSLTTTISDNTGQAGNMIDVTALTGNITIDSFDINLNNSATIEIYYKAGSYIGYETNASAWTLLGSTQVYSIGSGFPSPCPIGGLTIPYGEMYALYITTTGGSINYTTLSSPPYHADGNLLIDNSCGKSYPFGSTFTPRDWNGTIHYRSSNDCPSPLVPVTVHTMYAIIDGAILDIINPITVFSECDYEQDVICTIYNNGLQPISGFNVYYILSNNTAITETYYDTLQPGESTVYTFSTQVILTYYGPYNICVGIITLNDGNNANNEVCENFHYYGTPYLWCGTSFPYVNINDPPIQSATTFAYDSEWWKFEVQDPHENVKVSLCGSYFDTQLEIWDDCCANTYLYHNDDACGAQSEITMNNGGIVNTGIYYVRIYGWSSAFGDFMLSITGDQVPKFEIIETLNSPTCHNASDGAIMVALGPTPGGSAANLPVNINWYDSNNNLISTADNLSGIPAGNYIVEVIDSTGWVQTETYTVTAPDELIITELLSNATSFGGNNGTINLSVSGGTTPYSFTWSTGDISEDLLACSAGEYGISISDQNACTTDSMITVATSIPPPYINLQTTNTIHNIFIPGNAEIKMDSLPVQAGSLLGVFYDSLGNDVCGGYVLFTPGQDTTLLAYGADSAQFNGFATGETFKWKLWDAAHIYDFDADALYDTLNFPDSNQFASNGSSGLVNLEVFSITTQTIILPAGWSMWSTYIEPLNTDIELIMADIVSPPFTAGILELAINGSGTIFWPYYGISQANFFATGEGYRVKINGSALVSFIVSGYQLRPESTPLSLPTGWSIIAYLRTVPANISLMMASLNMPAASMDYLIIAKNGTGQIYWPAYGVNSIGNMVPGRGYQIKLSTTYEGFLYPANQASSP